MEDIRTTLLSLIVICVSVSLAVLVRLLIDVDKTALKTVSSDVVIAVPQILAIVSITLAILFHAIKED